MNSLADAASEPRESEPLHVRIQVLGPVAVTAGDAPIPLPSHKQRDLLAALSLSANSTVSMALLAEQVWGDRPPQRIRETLYTYVRRLRQVVGSEAILTGADGYRLRTGDCTLDLLEFRALVQEARRVPDREEERRLLVAALDLWHGPALDDVTSEALRRDFAPRLAEEWLAVVTRRIDIDLESGRHAELFDELRCLTRDHPLNERLWERLMTALVRSGRQAEALQAYGNVRAHIKEQLGLEPGSGLQRLQARILARDPSLHTAQARPAAPAAPARPSRVPAQRDPLPEPPQCQLPRGVTHFVGHERQLAELRAALTDTTGHAPLVIVAGPPGVGKTALTVRAAQQLADHFPDGQWFVRLRGAGEHPADVGRLLGELLQMSGVESGLVPASADARAAMLRARLADRRILIVMDDAGNASQVRPLLPGAGRTAVLVSSRYSLRPLVALEGAGQIELGVLAPADSHTLLDRVLGTERTAADPEATAALVRHCAGLPLALRLAAANVLSRPAPGVDGYVAELNRGDRLAKLAVGGGDEHAAVEAAFALSYDALPEAGGTLFRLLGAYPGPDFTAEAASVLADIGADEAERLLGELADAHLIMRGTSGRYHFHDLLRLFAVQRAAAELTEDERAAALARWHAHAVNTLHAVHGLLYPGMVRLEAERPVPGPDRTFDGTAAARQWIDAENTNLLATARNAAATPSRWVTWELVDGLRGYAHYHQMLPEWCRVVELGLREAIEHDAHGARAAMAQCLGGVAWAEGATDTALAHYRTALVASRAAGVIASEAAALSNMGAVQLESGRLREAVRGLTAAAVIWRKNAWQGYLATTLTNLGLVHLDLGALDEALRHLTEGWELCRRIGFESGEAAARCNMALALTAMGRYAEARRHAEESLAAHRVRGSAPEEAAALTALAVIARETGDLDGAREYAAAAVDVARQVDRPLVLADAMAIEGMVAEEPELAERMCADARDHARAVGHPRGEVASLLELAAIARRGGDTGRARSRAGSALRVARRVGLRRGEGRAHLEFARLSVAGGDRDEAHEHASRAREIFGAAGDEPGRVQAARLLELAGRVEV